MKDRDREKKEIWYAERGEKREIYTDREEETEREKLVTHNW